MESKPIVIALSSIKGGVGKTNAAILLADCLASAGKRVLLIDSDLNNSLSFHYLTDQAMLEETKRKNIAAALSDEGNDLYEYAVPTRREGIDLIASSAHLADLRTISEKRLARMLKGREAGASEYGIIIIDCHPTYDNIVLNALHASDYVITPVLKDLFSFNAADFLSKVLPRDVEGFKNWFVLINGYDKRFGESKAGRQNDFIELYRNGGFPLTPEDTWLPWTAQIHSVIDYHKKLSSREGIAGAVYNPALYKAVTALAGCFFDEGLTFPEAF